jgi:hypothetical protein
LSLVDDVRKQIESRLRELKPLVDEYQQLEKLASGWVDDARELVSNSLGRGRGGATKSPSRSRKPRSAGSGRKRSTSSRSSSASKTTTRKSTARKSTGGAPRGRRGGNTRANQALELVKSKPGITIPELATQMGIKQNYLYRVLPSLESEGKVKRDGRGWVSA